MHDHVNHFFFCGPNHSESVKYYQNPNRYVFQINFRAQVVGWPPIRSFRKNVMAVQKNSNDNGEKSGSSGTGVAFVKVSMDGAPYLRKVDLKLYKSYQELSDALGKMFSSFTIGNKMRHT